MGSKVGTGYFLLCKPDGIVWILIGLILAVWILPTETFTAGDSCS